MILQCICIVYNLLLYIIYYAFVLANEIIANIDATSDEVCRNGNDYIMQRRQRP